MKDLRIFMDSKWLLPMLICLVFACSKPKKPDGILSQPEMVKVMMDLYIAEDKVNRLGIPRDSSEKLFAIFRPRIFKSAQLSDSAFDRSFRYYMDQPKQLEQIYSAVVDSLQLREQQASTKPQTSP